MVIFNIIRHFAQTTTIMFFWFPRRLAPIPYTVQGVENVWNVGSPFYILSGKRQQY